MNYKQLSSFDINISMLAEQVEMLIWRFLIRMKLVVLWTNSWLSGAFLGCFVWQDVIKSMHPG